MEKAGIKLEGMPQFAKQPQPKEADEIPYAVLPEEARRRFLNLAETLRQSVRP